MMLLSRRGLLAGAALPLAAPALEEQKRLARQLQLQVFEDVSYIPIGQSFAPIAYRNDLIGLLTGYSLFWNVKRG